MLRNESMNRAFLLAVAAVVAVWAAGCRPAGPEVVVYVSLDSEFSEPILEEFAAESGVDVRPKFDVESTKTVGLANALIAEASRPRCDVFWNNEILNTLRLQQRGLLDVYHSPAAEAFPAQFKSPEGYWHGFAGRARILIVNTDLVPEGRRPDSIHDLADAAWRGRVSLAKPLFGTTATHAACLFETLGEEAAKEFFRTLRANDVRIESGNKQVAVAVASGEAAFGLTDTDDALVMIARGDPVTIVYPDQGEGRLGTLFIPNTLAILKERPHPDEARRLVDYLLQAKIERRLAEGASGQIPLNPAVEATLQVETPGTIQAMDVDFAAAAERWEAAAEFIRQEFAVE